jgi:hypothetical protein
LFSLFFFSFTGTLQHEKGVDVDWPVIGVDPIPEWDKSKKIFCMAFPWLFPGGIGDVNDFPNDNAKEWAKIMTYYEDGRFARDKQFSFMAENYILRKRNSSSGRYYVTKFHTHGPTNLEELKEQIEEGNNSFVNSLLYYLKSVKGSNQYWKTKRSELYSWINHHAEVNNKVPMYFITLSCAEYLWPDVIDLIKDRLKMAGRHAEVDKLDVNTPEFVRLVNEYSIVVQEYYQQRVKNWLETVGKEMLGIENYWCRYEFTPGRGQIHVHLLATSSDQYIYSFMKKDKEEYENGEEIAAERMKRWASKRFGMTACVREGYEQRSREARHSGVTVRLTDINHDEQSLLEDIEGIKGAVQHHMCNGFCMRCHGNNDR